MLVAACAGQPAMLHPAPLEAEAAVAPVDHPALSQDAVPGRTAVESPPTRAPASGRASATPSQPVAGHAGVLPRPPKGAVPILYYHRVAAPPTDWADMTKAQRNAALRYTVTPAAFAAQLDWLKEHGYTTILPRDLAAHWDKGRKLPSKPVIITFDDGTPDWVRTVLPMLEERGMVAEFYLTLDAIEVGAISWDGVRKLAAAGNGIGSHHVNHVQLTRLGANRPPASEAVMWREVSESRRIIAREVGVAPDSLAYVGGGFDATLQRLVEKAGYATARSIIRGVVQRESDRYELRVVAVTPRDDVASIPKGTMVPGLPSFAAKVLGQTTR
jgi:peptidoglycan/xylan/chitin deacetylase (PgdA/CDA1 family)